VRFGRILPRSFYARPTIDVARDLLGRVLVHRETAGAIVETEAYLGAGDLAAHSARGLTPRTRVIFGPPGHAYVYLIYGMYECLNLVAEPDGQPGCVLIRAVRPIAGLKEMRARRGARCPDAHLADGPGKLTQAFAISLEHNGLDVTAGNLVVRAGSPGDRQVQITPRIGISKSADLPLRFLLTG
jgi:DNA-3-methyladenine glycosylase